MIPDALESLSSTRRETFRLMGNLSQEQLDYAPREGSWSVGEIVDHLALTESFLCRQLEELVKLRRSGSTPVLRRGFSDLDISIGPFPKQLLPLFEVPFTMMTMVTPRPVLEYMAQARWIPFRNPAASEPQRGRPKEELERDLEASEEAMTKVFAENDDLDFTELIVRHPLMGTNHGIELLQFDVQHEKRHQKQIEDVLAAPGFPRTGPGPVAAVAG